MMAKKKVNQKSKLQPRPRLHPAKVQVSAKKNLSRKKSRQTILIMDEPLKQTNLSDDLPEEAGDEKQPEIMAGLSDDPVRLYLREIGQVKVLSSDEEFSISTIIEAMRLVDMFRHHPVGKGVSSAMGIYHGLLTELLTSWKRFGQDAKRLRIEWLRRRRFNADWKRLRHLMCTPSFLTISGPTIRFGKTWFETPIMFFYAFIFCLRIIQTGCLIIF